MCPLLLVAVGGAAAVGGAVGLVVHHLAEVPPSPRVLGEPLFVAPEDPDLITD